MSEPIKNAEMADVRCAADDSGLPIKKMKMMSKNVEFFVRLCNDVLLEVLKRGDRRQLAELEKTGRRFYLIIDCCIKEAPLLRLHLSLQPFEETFVCMIGDRENDSERGLGLSEIELKATVEAAEVPPYLRFHLVQLSYLEADKGTAEERFAWFQMVFLPSLKHALIGSKFKFICAIEDEAVKRYGPTANGEESYYENSPADFEDSDTLLLHISSKLLPIFDQCCSYKFCITLPNKQAVISENDIISEILQFDSVSRCSNVSFLLTHVNYNWPQCLPYLPVETIGNWLNRPLNAGQKQNKRLLQIKVEHDEIPNVYEMFENLEKEFREAQVAAQPFTLTLGCDMHYHRRQPELYDEFVEDELITNKKTGEQLSMAMVEGAIHADHDYDNDTNYPEEYEHYVDILLEIKRESIDQTEAKKNDKDK